jgi:hypothetical protein
VATARRRRDSRPSSPADATQGGVRNRHGRSDDEAERGAPEEAEGQAEQCRREPVTPGEDGGHAARDRAQTGSGACPLADEPSVAGQEHGERHAAGSQVRGDVQGRQAPVTP